VNVGKDILEENGDRCPCCGRYVNREPIDVYCRKKDLAFLGSGVPLYFGFIEGILVLNLILFVTSGEYNLITNWYLGTDCHPV